MTKEFDRYPWLKTSTAGEFIPYTPKLTFEQWLKSTPDALSLGDFCNDTSYFTIEAHLLQYLKCAWYAALTKGKL